MKKSLLISGHRGTRVHAIENTAKAFDYCISNDVKCIEFDVKKTSDGEIVVFHDSHINRLMNGKGNIEELSLKKLRQFEYQDGQKIQTLTEFFQQIDKQAVPMLEIKSRNIGEKVINIVKTFNYKPSEIIIQSFNIHDLQECYALAPEFQYGMCMSVLGKFPFLRKTIAKWMYRKFLQPYQFITWLNLDGPFIYNEFIDLVKSHNLRIILGANHTWNYLDKIERWSIEILNCDDPIKIRDLVKQLGYGILEAPCLP